MNAKPTRRAPAHALAAAGVGTATLGAALSLSACVGPPAVQLAGASSEATCPVAASQEPLDLRIAYQSEPSPQLYLKDRGVVEACLPRARVTWTRYPTGQDVVQAFSAGSADVGYLGTPPVAKGISAPVNQDLRVVHVSIEPQDSLALVAKDARTVGDLRGKRIGVGFSSTAHYALLKVLAAAGLEPGRDVEVVNISPDHQPAAWSGDEIDAIYTWDPTLQKLQAMGGETIVSNADAERAGAYNYDVAAATGALVDDHRSAVETFSALNDWAAEQYAANPAGFIGAVAAQLGQEEGEVKSLLARGRIVPAGEQPALLAATGGVLFDTAEFFAEQGEVETAAPEDACSAAVYPRASARSEAPGGKP